jgi:hypothetical protein
MIDYKFELTALAGGSVAICLALFITKALPKSTHRVVALLVFWTLAIALSLGFGIALRAVGFQRS